MTIKLFSFFSGAGFLDLGFEDEGYRVVHVNENHAPFLEAYKYSRKILGIDPPQYSYHSGSITDFYDIQLNAHLKQSVVASRGDGSIVGFIGGPPCPDFSVGGKNRGRHGDHGKLSQTYIDMICYHEPDFFLFENVKGLWKTKLHRHFYEELKALLKQCGYVLTERLTNSIEYGAPQDRERIILIGFKESVLREREKTFIAGAGLDSFPWLDFAVYPDRTAFSYEWPGASPFVEDQDARRPVNVPEELTVEYWFRLNDAKNHPNSEHCFKPKAGLARFRSVAEGDDSKKSFKRLHRWRYSPTAAYGNNEVHLHPYKPRRISVAEALAIQSLPANFELPPQMTLSNMFKTVGNGVPYLAAKNIARSIKSFLEEPYAQTNSTGHCSCDCKIAERSSVSLCQS